MGDREPRWEDKRETQHSQQRFLGKIEGLYAMTYVLDGSFIDLEWDIQQRTYIIEKLEEVISRLQDFQAKFVETSGEDDSTPPVDDAETDSRNV